MRALLIPATGACGIVANNLVTKETADLLADQIQCVELGDLNASGYWGDGSLCYAELCINPQTGRGYYEIGDGQSWEKLHCESQCSTEDNCNAYRQCGWNDEDLSQLPMLGC